MNNGVYEKILNFKRKYPSTIAWRLKAHSKVVEKHLNQGEKVLYAFAGQKIIIFMILFRLMFL